MRTRQVQIPALAGAQYDGKPAPGWTSYTVFKRTDCKRIKQSTSPHVTGYGLHGKGKTMRKVCFDCCGIRDEKEMIKTGRAVLYLTQNKVKQGEHFVTAYRVTNWPGTLEIKPWRIGKGRHNIAGTRIDVWFDFKGQSWHGVNIGDNDILRCKRSNG